MFRSLEKRGSLSIFDVENDHIIMTFLSLSTNETLVILFIYRFAIIKLVTVSPKLVLPIVKTFLKSIDVFAVPLLPGSPFRL